MTRLEIKTKLDNLSYLFNVLENDYAALELKAIIKELEDDWNASDYYYEQIQKAINYEQDYERRSNN